MQINTEGRKQVLAEVAEVKSRLHDLVLVLASQDLQAQVLLDTWQTAIARVIAQFELYLQSDLEVHKVDRVIHLAQRIRMSFTSTPMYGTSERPEIVTAYSELAREMIASMPQAFLSQTETDQALDL